MVQYEISVRQLAAREIAREQQKDESESHGNYLQAASNI